MGKMGEKNNQPTLTTWEISNCTQAVDSVTNRKKGVRPTLTPYDSEIGGSGREGKPCPFPFSHIFSPTLSQVMHPIGAVPSKKDEGDGGASGGDGRKGEKKKKAQPRRLYLERRF